MSFKKTMVFTIALVVGLTLTDVLNTSQAHRERMSIPMSSASAMVIEGGLWSGWCGVAIACTVAIGCITGGVGAVVAGAYAAAPCAVAIGEK